MIVNRKSLFRKMLVTPRLNLKCDDVKIRLAFASNDKECGWIIENFNGDGETNWYKEKTLDVVEMIFNKYEEVNVTWSRSW